VQNSYPIWCGLALLALWYLVARPAKSADLEGNPGAVTPPEADAVTVAQA
jgi:hypothetical protein